MPSRLISRLPDFWEGEAPAEPVQRAIRRLSRSFALPKTICQTGKLVSRLVDELLGAIIRENYSPPMLAPFKDRAYREHLLLKFADYRDQSERKTRRKRTFVAT